MCKELLNKLAIQNKKATFAQWLEIDKGLEG